MSSAKNLESMSDKQHSDTERASKRARVESELTVPETVSQNSKRKDGAQEDSQTSKLDDSQYKLEPVRRDLYLDTVRCLD